MKYFIILILLSLSGFICAQNYIQGHQTIEYNSDSIPGLSIKNLNDNHGKPSLSLYNDMNSSLELGVLGSQTFFVGNSSFLKTSKGVPLFLAISDYVPIQIDTSGKTKFEGGDYQSDAVVEIATDYTGSSDLVGIKSDITPQGEFSLVGIGGEFIGGTRGITAFSANGVGANIGSNNGIGAYITSVNDNALFANTNSGIAIKAKSVDSTAIYAESTNDVSILGNSTDSTAIKANSINGFGIQGVSANDHGVVGLTNYGHGVFGQSNYSIGINGTSTHSIGVRGSSVHGVGVVGSSSNDHGVEGYADQSNKYDFHAAGPGMDLGFSSSRRWKSNVQNIANPLSLISKLRGVRYDWDEEHGGGRHDIGFIAEEVGAVLPEIVNYEDNGIDAIAMDYTKIPALIVEAFNTFRDQYEEKIAELEGRIAELEQQQ